MLCGGFKEIKDASSEEQYVLDQVKGEVLMKLNENGKKLAGDSEVKAVTFTTQVVAGKYDTYVFLKDSYK